MWSPAPDNGTVFIDGKWRPAATGAAFESRNPATSEVIGTVSDAGAAETAEAIAAASAAARGWAAKTSYERAAVLLEAHRLMTERAEDLARLMTAEQGKPLRAARNEVRYAPTSCSGSPRKPSASTARRSRRPAPTSAS